MNSLSRKNKLLSYLFKYAGTKEGKILKKIDRKSNF